MDPRSKHHSAMHQFLISGRGAVAVEFAFVLPIILLIIWAFWQMSESYRLQWTLNRQTASLADMLINQPEQLNFGGGTESVTLPLEQQFPVLIASANEMLKNAISKDAAGIRTGLTVEYATGKITNDGVPVIYTILEWSKMRRYSWNASARFIAGGRRRRTDAPIEFVKRRHPCAQGSELYAAQRGAGLSNTCCTEGIPESLYDPS